MANENEVHVQVDRMLTQRALILISAAQSPNAAMFQAAVGLLNELGPETLDDNEDKRTARAYLTRLVDELPAS